MHAEGYSAPASSDLRSAEGAAVVDASQTLPARQSVLHETLEPCKWTGKKMRKKAGTCPTLQRNFVKFRDLQQYADSDWFVSRKFCPPLGRTFANPPRHHETRSPQTAKSACSNQIAVCSTLSAVVREHVGISSTENGGEGSRRDCAPAAADDEENLCVATPHNVSTTCPKRQHQRPPSAAAAPRPPPLLSAASTAPNSQRKNNKLLEE